MTRINITLSANRDSGEGAPTERSQRALNNFAATYGTLFACDVIGDWIWDLKQAFLRTEIVSMAHETQISMDHASTPEEFAMFLWEHGVNNPDVAEELADVYWGSAHEDLDIDFAHDVRCVMENDDFEEKKKQKLKADVDKIIQAIFDEENGDLSERERSQQDRSYSDRLHLMAAQTMYERGIWDGQPMGATA